MSITRRSLLAGMGAALASSAWAQAIGPQSDPWAQVDPYADPRNGFPAQGSDGGRAFGGAEAPQPQARSAMKPRAAAQSDAPAPPSDEEIAAQNLMEALTDPERFEILAGRQGLYYCTVAAKQKAQGPIVANAGVQRAFQQFCQPFFQVAERQTLPWEVYVTDYDRPNGLAFGGGKLTITSGTIRVADHPAELAALVAHEIGHNDCRHISKGQEVDALMTLGKSGGIAVDRSTKAALDGLQPQFQQILQRGFARDQEREADAHVPLLFGRLNMDAERYVTMFQKMMRIYGNKPDEKTCLTDTHPVTMERIELIRAQIAGRRVRSEYTPPGWAELKRIYPTPSEYRWG